MVNFSGWEIRQNECFTQARISTNASSASKIPAASALASRPRQLPDRTQAETVRLTMQSSNSFDIIPDQNSIAAVDRDIRFFPTPMSEVLFFQKSRLRNGIVTAISVRSICMKRRRSLKFGITLMNCSPRLWHPGKTVIPSAAPT